MSFDFLDYVILIFGAYYVIAIGIFQFGLKGVRANKLVNRLGNVGARIFYIAVGLFGIILVLTEIL